jgi:restriction system protein
VPPPTANLAPRGLKEGRDAHLGGWFGLLCRARDDGPQVENARLSGILEWAGLTNMAAAGVPQDHELLWPVLQAVSEHGGSASIGEIAETVTKREGYSEAQQSVLHHDGPETEISYRLGWARTHLKGMGLLTNSTRGVWALTDEGTALVADSLGTDMQQRARIRELWSSHLVELRTARKRKASQGDREVGPTEPAGELDWKEKLLGQLMNMRPDAFERLAMRLLREADFDSVNVTGKSGDGGIDGLAILGR